MNYGRRMHSRHLEVGGRLSSAQPLNMLAGQSAKVQVMVPFSYKEAERTARRIVNLDLLKRHVFGDEAAKLADAIEMSPQRLSALFDLEVVFSDELAEHIEKTLGLPGGWLDKRREWNEEELAVVQQAMQQACEQQGPETAHAPAPEPRVWRMQAVLHTPEESSTTSAAPSVEQAVHPSTTQATLQTFAQEAADMNKQPSSTTAKAPRQHAAMACAWLKNELAQRERGTQSRLARAMGRNPNDLSAWLNGLRPMPAAALQDLLRALPSFDAQLAQGFVQRLQEVHAEDAQPALMREQEGAQQPSSATPQAAPDAPDAQPRPAAAAKPAADRAVQLRRSRSGSAAYVTFQHNAQSERIAELALRTAQVLAEVVKSCVAISEHAEHAD